MPTEQTRQKSTALGVELLEARTVPAAFGATQGLSVAVGDVIPGTNFGPYQYVMGSGPGVKALVRVFDDQGAVKYQFNPFGEFKGGVFVAVGDVTGDGQKDIVVSTAAGTTGKVRVYSFVGNQLRMLSLLTPYGPNYVGGVQVTTGDVTGDATKEIIVGQQTNGSVVKVFGVDPASGGTTYFQLRRFQAFEAGYKGGISIASANIDATENDPLDPYNYDYAEIMVGKAKDEPLLKIFDAQAPTVVTRAQYLTFDPDISKSTAGISVVAGDTDGNRGAEIYCSQLETTTVRVFDGETGIPRGDFEINYPIGFGRRVNLAINDLADDIGGTFEVADAFSVAGAGPQIQVPVVFPGAANSPAGFNGSRAAP